jgi:uncharacterized protein
MTPVEIIAIFIAAAIAAAINAVAGGGSFVSFPTLLAFQHPPIETNATSSVSLWPGSAASTWSYRKLLSEHRRILILMGSVSFVGGIAGSILLLNTPPSFFLAVLPWLMLVATLLFALNSAILQRVRRLSRLGESNTGMALVMFLQFLTSIYGGFFGGGQGILILASLSLLGLKDIHTMNGLKAFIATVTNGVSNITFIIAGAILWPQALVMITGAILGGYFGAHYAQRIPPRYIRAFVIIIGTVLTIYFFVRPK